MSGLRLRTILHRLWRSAGTPNTGTVGDADLLRRWVAGRDPMAFEVLLWRHGPMILELCRRLLRREQDAEDAFQSAFLALALKGNAISKGEAVGSWLYTVAYRAALQLRGASRLPHSCDPHALDRLAAPAPGEAGARELRAALDEEVRRLPEKYRAAFVLCYLEGLTNEEAAQRLGRPVGTVVSRLARARHWLRRRLTGRGLAPAVVVSLLSARAARSTLPALLTEEVTRAAALVAAGKAAEAVSPAVAALTHGVLRAMCKSKMVTIALIVLAVAALGVIGTSISLVDQNQQRSAVAWYEAQAAFAQQPNPSGFSPTRPPSPTPPFGKRMPAQKPADSTASEKAADKTLIRQVRDEIEVLEAQLAVKSAQLQASKIACTVARERWDRMQQITGKAPSVVSESEITKAKQAAALAEAEMRVREAEVREPTVRLSQARRRLAGLEGAKPAADVRPDIRERIKAMEQKLDTMRKELEALRKELGDKKPGNP
jgi:RNA polymerase sigma factor (sigma-70 family)